MRTLSLGDQSLLLFPALNGTSFQRSLAICTMKTPHRCSTRCEFLEGGLAALAQALNLSFETEVWAVIIDQVEAENS